MAYRIEFLTDVWHTELAYSEAEKDLVVEDLEDEGITPIVTALR